ncbi:MAG TPA: biopolymer transporter ExbD [Gemmatimonadota bacterium]|nr:biopolymer transporter ExbD [Gemmatimonadota bacterium]
MRLETGRRRKAGINITSLIDVVFLLLLFFVVTSTFLEQPGLDLALPEASTAEGEREGDVTVSVAPDGTVYLAGEAVPAGDLAGRLEAALSVRDPKRVILEADRSVSHGRVVEVMDAARRAGATALVVATRRPGPEAGGR